MMPPALTKLTGAQTMTVAASGNAGKTVRTLKIDALSVRRAHYRKKKIRRLIVKRQATSSVALPWG
jgi:hypothetical protein